MNRTLVVMPTYNERENLPRMAQRLRDLPVKVDLLVVDDNSPDGTGKLADELAAKHPEIHVLHRAEKNGLGRAYIAGFKWALDRGYDFVFEIDGDFSHNPDDIPAFLNAAKDADLVLWDGYPLELRSRANQVFIDGRLVYTKQEGFLPWKGRPVGQLLP